MRGGSECGDTNGNGHNNANTHRITSLYITGLTTPVYGATPDTTFTVYGGGTPVSVSWNAGTSTFGENTHYTATIIIQNASGYVFNSVKPTVTLNGDAISSSYVTLNTATQLLTVTYTFPATESKILPTITLSANVTSGTLPLPVKFTYTVTNATSTSWVYGDGYSLFPHTAEHSITPTRPSETTRQILRPRMPTGRCTKWS